MVTCAMTISTCLSIVHEYQLSGLLLVTLNLSCLRNVSYISMQSHALLVRYTLSNLSSGWAYQLLITLWLLLVLLSLIAHIMFSLERSSKHRHRWLKYRGKTLASVCS
jgi:hypothetical protein